MQFESFAQFYPYYLKEHSDKRCRIMHYVGSTLVLLVLAWALMSSNFWWLLALPLIGYGFAWLGHFVFEHNKPATFKYPAYSLLGDWVMYKDAWVFLLTRKRSAAAEKAWG
ncbi:DUF962 domain-containing protein [Aliidiomarina celeris]|uniref:DUF962 domain-containing protein n=1 Tax=Aliidiomarina celeris TaxID=2249428 RepID=UPI000DE962F1|nr:DUF962 domain-containing protein [Aliidiomarina celeris]